MARPHVLVIPFPAQGHVIPTMELAQRLVKQGIKVTFINTEVNHKIVTSNLQVDKDGFGDLMQMVSIPDGLEPWEDRSDVRKLILSILQTMSGKLEKLIETINTEDSNKITCVIADACMGLAIQAAANLGIRRACFWPASVTTLASTLSIHKLIDDGIINKNGLPLTDQIIQLSETMPPIKPENLVWAAFQDVPTIEAAFQLFVKAEETCKMTEWFICNSTTELESAAFSLYPQLLPIGPLLATNRLANQTGHFWQEDSTCLAWLDQQPPSSVIYIAFGSFTIFNQTQFQELAFGLELSNKPFLWVMRPGMTKETTDAYPDGYIERVRSHGRIISWAPQQKVLAHPSIACFISHCGWNSTLEGVTNGLPFLCWPYFGDQFHNKTYICDIWKTGLGFNKDEAGIITREEIKSKVELLLSDKTFREKALDIKDKIRSAVNEGGCSQKNLNNFIEWLKEKNTDDKDQPDSL
ncbi:UDP-glucuronosyl/UDP-glucosyltransferase [Artemisia annua]|uniref:UDP-glucuronosyl/UDP-glucosyltransferase n=1 Tax=Artemisia annua TaxID=35608 RepID=A0A2U1M6V3_ARTAN|nr:UDP-glucuronosyl/UDP-glucosyltransferase [Artemisia annua]